MINLDKYVQDFISGNWLALSIFLLILKGIARQFHVKVLHNIYLILQNSWAIVRPGTSADSLKKE